MYFDFSAKIKLTQEDVFLALLWHLNQSLECPALYYYQLNNIRSSTYCGNLVDEAAQVLNRSLFFLKQSDFTGIPKRDRRLVRYYVRFHMDE